MKNAKGLVLVLLFLLILNACSTENQEVNDQLSTKKSQAALEIATINNLLDNIKPVLSERASKLDEFNFITFEVVKNLNTNEITLDNFKEVSLFPIADIQSSQRTTYVINCDNGGDGSDNWDEECQGISSCGRLIKKCLDGGGCAEICQMKSNDGQSYVSVELTFIPGKKL